ncbi:hypothetical protein A1F95_05969, partial [Pyrenophora tritici-repentis]
MELWTRWEISKHTKETHLQYLEVEEQTPEMARSIMVLGIYVGLYNMAWYNMGQFYIHPARLIYLDLDSNRTEEGVFCTTLNKQTGNATYPNRSGWMKYAGRFAQDCEDFDGMRPHSSPLVPGQRAKTVLMGELDLTFQFLILRPVPDAQNTYERFAYMDLDSRLSNKQ